MKKLERLLAICICGALALGSLGALAESPDKEEVVYAVLDSDGGLSGAYVVNIFPGGEVTDYGEYSDVHMLNTEDELDYDGETIRFSSDEERVYYQGNMQDAALPWIFEISYTLDGESITAQEIAGKIGHMEMRIAVKQNPLASGEFYQSHALQITATLDTEKCANIKAEGATQANVGSKRQLSYILLPGSDSEFVIAADVTDFEMDALAINGVRMSLDVEISGDEFGDAAAELKDAAAKLDDGANEIYDGAVELSEGAQSAYDGGIELRDGAQELNGGLEELDGHSAELMSGADMMLDAIFDAANASLDQSRADFEALGITLNPLTRENYRDEIGRLQRELLKGVEEYVYEEAENTLRQQVYDAVYAEVERQVNAAAYDQVERAVTEAAEAEVRAQVEANAGALVRTQVEAEVRAQVGTAVCQSAEEQAREEAVAVARQQIESAVRNPDEETITAQVDAQLESEEVQAQIDAAVETQLRSSEVQTQIDAQLEAAVRPQVEAAVESEVRAQVEAEVRAQVRSSIYDQVEAGIRAEIAAQLPQSAPTTEEPSAWRRFFDWIFVAAYAEDESSDPVLDALVKEKMTSDEVQAQIDALTDEAMSSAETQAIIEQQVGAQLGSESVQAAINAKVSEQVALPENRVQAETAARTEIRVQAEAAARESVRAAVLDKFSSMTDEEIAALVDAQLQTAEVQAQIDAAVEEQLASAEVKAMIEAEINAQMQSPEIRSSIDAACQEQLASGDIHAMIDAEVEAQLESAEGRLISENISTQFNSAEVQAAIQQNIDAQMASDEVQQIIEDEIVAQRSGETYLNSVAEALEANGINSAPYLALGTLRSSLDYAVEFYDGLAEYTDGVALAAESSAELFAGAAELAGVYDPEDSANCAGLGALLDGSLKLMGGASEMKGGADEFSAETEDIDTRIADAADEIIARRTGANVPTVSFADARNGEIASVQFVISTPPVKVETPQEEPEEPEEEKSFTDRFGDLFD